jgi:flavin reductase (DIM6/NTAB) family NADH-FMN oxidoreductase RutF
MLLKTSELNPGQVYKLLIGSVVPRPIAWVSTISADGKPNLAPFSYFTVASSNPPVVCFSPALKGVSVDGKTIVYPKDSLANVRETEEFVVNIVSYKLAKQMNQCSAEYGRGVSEFEKTGLTPVSSAMVKPPRVGEALISMECRLRQIINFGDHPGAGNLILGDVLCFNIDDKVIDARQHVNIEALDPIGRLAGNDYCRVSDIFALDRPDANYDPFQSDAKKL